MEAIALFEIPGVLRNQPVPWAREHPHHLFLFDLEDMLRDMFELTNKEQSGNTEDIVREDGELEPTAKVPPLYDPLHVFFDGLVP